MKPFLIALALSRALDVTSTCYNLAHGLGESNPFLPSTCKAQIGVQASLITLQVLSLSKLSHTHPTLARAISLVSVGIESTAVVLNVHAVVKLGRR